MRAGISRKALGSFMALPAVLVTSSAVAQNAGSVSDYRLPEAGQSPAPRVQGPVDPDNPYSQTATNPRIEPSPSPTPTPAPRIFLPAPSTAAPSPEQARPRASTARPAAAESERSSQPLTVPPVVTDAPVATNSPDAVAEAPPTPQATTMTPNLSANNAEGSYNWLALGGLAFLLMAGAGIFLLRRRKTASQEEADAYQPPRADPTPQPSPPARTTPSGTSAERKPVTAAVAQPATSPSSDDALPLAIVYTPRAIRLSLVYATLQYELEVANTGSVPLPSLQMRGDLSSAHASISAHEQLAPAPEYLSILHTLPALGPGETASLKGEVRVPLQQVRTVTKGTARFLVPLARFCLLAPDGAAIRRVFSVGPLDPAGSGAISSVRLDAGPRNLRELGAREIEAARSFTLDPVAVHG